MRKYAIAHSFLMFASVLASTPSHVVRRGVTAIDPPVKSSQPVDVSTGSSTGLATSPPIVTPPSSSAPPLTTSSSSSLSTPTLLTTSSVTTTSSSSITSSSTSASPSSTSLVTTPTSVTTSINSNGVPTTVIVVPSTDTSSSAAPASTGTSGDSSSHSGTIIGLSVAGGAAALAIIAFIIWKLTRKRFSGMDDADEAIKWPELNHQSHSPEESNDALSRQFSSAYSGGPSRNASQGEVADPYAVPPLPHLNPNQPYRDDPYAASNVGYYDPYRGPVPQTFHDASIDGHENIPMSTYPPGSRSRSPGPAAAYGMPVPGRASPGPAAVYDVGPRGSPAPGRMASPGPAGALGLDRRQSPGPQYAMSGQPEMTTRM